MNETGKLKITPLRLALVGSAAIIALLIILSGAAYLRNRAANSLQEDLETIRTNFARRKEADINQISTLQEELEQIQEQVQILEESYPELGEPYPLYDQVQEIAFRSQVNLVSITRNGSEFQDTSQGRVQITSYALQLKGEPKTCVAFIQNLENAGDQSVSPDGITISPGINLCELTVRIFSQPE